MLSVMRIPFSKTQFVAHGPVGAKRRFLAQRRGRLIVAALRPNLVRLALI